MLISFQNNTKKTPESRAAFSLLIFLIRTKRSPCFLSAAPRFPKSFAGVCLFLQYSRIQHTLIERDPECLTLAHRISFSSKEKSSLATGFPIIHRLGAPG